MINEKVVVKLKSGLQARPAALFVQEANRYVSDIFVLKDDKKVNGKSIMGIMSLAISSGTEIELQVDGNDAEQAISSLKDFISKEE